VFKASPERIYEALMDSAEHSAFTGGQETQISRDLGGSFTCFGGFVAGRNIELVANKRIVQAWRASDWGDGVYSILRYELEPQGGDTKLVFDQAGVPDEHHEHIDSGWKAMYWEPLAKYLA
jgi:activator of HSP90 ATPase